MNNEITTELYMILALDRVNRYARKLKARLAVRPPKLAAGEVSLSLSISVPRSLFARPALSATITVPACDEPKAVIDADVMDNIAETLTEQLGMRVVVSAAEVEPAHD